MLDPVQNTVPNPATLSTIAKVPTVEDPHSLSCLPHKEHCRFFLNREETERERLEDLFSFSCLPPKEHCRFFLNREETEGERKKERENEWPRQFPACLIYPASL